MKHEKIYQFVLCAICAAVLIFFSGCKGEETAPATLNGNVNNPSWNAPDNYDYSSSMTAIIKVSLAERYPGMSKDWVQQKEDRIAAFAGEQCLGVAEPDSETGLFFLYIAGPQSGGSGESLMLRYFSAHYKNMFEAASAFNFKTDDHLGTVAQPLTPDFVVVK